jgi:hypothetical protein
LREQIRWGTKAMDIIADVSETSPPSDVAKASPPTMVAATVAPPPPLRGVTILRAAPGSGPVVKLEPPTPSGLPSVESIFDKYLEASGGKVAFEKITSRVSTGSVEITALAITGTAELNEQAPGRSSLKIEAPGLGIIQSTFDGNDAWLQDPLQGFIRFTGLGLEVARAGAIFDKQTKLKELYPNAVLLGKEKLGGKDSYVLRMGFEKWYFDVESGLLMRRGNTYFDDYRQVDGIKLPFKMRDEIFSGAGIIYQFNEIKHNVKIDEAKFTAYPSCFTKPD